MITKEQYQQMTTTWSTKKEHTAAEHILYNLLRGKDAKLGFTPIASHNTNKITSNNCNPYNGFTKAKLDALRKINQYFQDASRETAKRLVRYGKYADENEAFADLTLRVAEKQAEIEKWFEGLYGTKLTPSIAEALKDAL